MRRRSASARVAHALIALGLLSPFAPVVAYAGQATPRDAAPVATGSASIAELRADVKATSERLARATEAWERGHLRLALAVQQRIGASQDLDALGRETARARDRIADLAASLYRNPVDPTITAWLSGDGRTIADLPHINATLGRTAADSRQDIATLASTTATRQKLLSQGIGAAAEATRLQGELDAQLQRLQNDAVASQKRLEAALDALRRAREAGSASRDDGKALCTSDVPPDALNGFLPSSALCFLRTAPGHRLARPAARAFDQLSTAFRAALGTPLCVTDSYRSYAAQVDVFRRKPSLAATPGRSQHGWGRAVDLCGGVQQYGTPPYDWLKQNAAAYGFIHPQWAEPDGSRPEPWHWEYVG